MQSDKPDFSGEWVLNRPASSLGPGAETMQGGTIQMDHREPVLRLTATLQSQTGPVGYEFELYSDGREVVSSRQEVTIVSRLAWEEDTLVASWRIRNPDGEMSVCFRYELIGDGRRLQASEQVRGPGRDQDNVWIFDRR